ncbi:MAG: TRAP transporter substrate-binding protein [Burkholderiaceae bacterium]|nr:TRAP transporter substrate-binding protein [Burkholderiaceae bacterium]
MNSVRLLAAAAAAALCLAGAAKAQDKPTELKLAHWVPANHLLAQTGFIPWGKSIEQASGGSIKVAIFPAQQLGKAPDHYDMARDGIAQVTFVNPGYQAGRFPIIAAGELPFLVDKPGPASKALDAWYRQHAEREMKDVKVCLTHLHVGTFHAKDKAITDPSQIKGMKIRPANGTVGQMVNVLGGTSVQVSAPEARDALSKGVADAITFPWNSISSFGIDKVTKFHTDMRLYAAVFVWAMNKDWYNGLSANQKKVMDDHCNNEWAAKVGAAWGDAEDAGREKLVAAGHTIVPMTSAQIETWRQAVAPVYDRWVDTAAKTGIDARKALADLRAELQKTGGAY